MPNKVSAAEEAGMSFEDRCEDALKSLRQLQEFFQKLSTANVQSAHEGTRKIETIYANSSEIARKLFKPITAGLLQELTELDERFYKSLWEGGLKTTREIYGSDATDFALKTIETERAGN